MTLVFPSLEHFGRPIALAELPALGKFDVMVTGASAVSTNGVRFGKGHGFFDLEWGMFTDQKRMLSRIAAATTRTSATSIKE
jgi:5-formyltetrahydrofolate cyclo-ligase